MEIFNRERWRLAMAPFWGDWKGQEEGDHPNVARMRKAFLIIVLLQLFLAAVSIVFNVYTKFDNSKKFKALGDSNIKLGQRIVELGSKVDAATGATIASSISMVVHTIIMDQKMERYTELGENRQVKNQKAFDDIRSDMQQLKTDLFAEMKNVIEKQIAATNATIETRQVAKAVHEKVSQKILTGSDIIQVRKREAQADKKLQQAQEIKHEKATYIWAWPFHPPGPVATPTPVRTMAKKKKK